MMIKSKDSREAIGAPPFCKHAGSRLLPNAPNILNCGLVLKLARYRVSRALEASLHTGLQFYYVIADPKVGEQHIYRNYFKCNIFQVTTDLLNSENLRISITQLCHELNISNFTMI